MFRPTRIVLGASVVLAAFFAGFWYRGRVPSAPPGRKVLYWVDPMHPSYKSDHPGIAPDCGMQLEPVYADGGLAPGAPGRVEIAAATQNALGIRLGRAERSAQSQTLRLLGRVTVDETRVYRLFASVEGWVREISSHAAGNIVQKDELLASYFSRDLLTPQQSYIYALNTKDKSLHNGESTPDQTRVVDSQLRAAEEGLRTLGLSEYQIQEIKKTRTATSLLQLRAPATGMLLARNVARAQRVDRASELYRMADLSRVWVLADSYESDGKLIPPEAPARVRYQDRVLAARISPALPQFDPSTRTLKVRLELDNPAYLLRPDMFVDVEVPVRRPSAVTVPMDAVIDYGTRKVVYLAADGAFEPRTVETGWRLGDRVAITHGLEGGESIVVGGTFLVDSESRLKLAALGRAGKSAAQATDPVCGMPVDPAKALKLEHGGKTWHFCGESCKKKFEQNPRQYSGAAS